MNRRGFLGLLASIAITTCIPKVFTPPNWDTLKSIIGDPPEPQYLPLSDMSRLLKEYYGDRIKDLIYVDNPLLAMIPKTSKHPGKYIPVPFN